MTLRTTKGDKPTNAVMPTAVAKKLKSFIGSRATGPLFMAGDHRVSVRHMQRRVAGWLAKAQVAGKSAHSLRHTFATSLLARTGDLRLVQAAMNHSSIVSTTAYVAVDKVRLRAAIGALA